MTVRFKCQSEYQKSYGVPRSRSLPPQRCTPLAGLRSYQMGISREPGLQRRKRLGPAGLAQSCTSLLCPSDPHQSPAEPIAHAHIRAPSAAPASRSRSAHRKKPSLAPRPPTPPPESRAEPESPAQPKTPERPQRAAGKSTKLHPSQPDRQPQQPSRPPTAAPDRQQLSANEVEHALRWRAGLRSEGQRSGGQKSEYHRQFSWKKPTTAASPVLTAEQVLYSSSRTVPPFKKNSVAMETEYQRSFQGVAPPTEPRLRTHLEHQQIPLFHKHMTNKKRKEESQKKPRPNNNAPTPQNDNAMPPPPPQVQGGPRMFTEYQSSFRSPLYRIPEKGGATDSDAPQVKQLKQLRQEASSYRRRAWGTNFSRDHLNQLRSEHNALWEPTDTTDSATDPPTPRLTFDLCEDPDSRSTPCVEALDLASRSAASSKRSSVVGSGEINTNKNTQTKAQTSQSPSAERPSAWEGGGEEEGEEEEGGGGNTDEEEGRLPTPRLKIRPVQRTHHDLTTPSTGGAILVGKVKISDESSPLKQQRCGSAVSVAAGADAVVDMPVKRKEAWSENKRPPSPGPSPDHKPASKPIRMKQTPPTPVAPPPLVPPPLHCIQGTLRHPDFQHNGELGLRFRELQCSGRGCGSDDDDRLSVMSWRSAASCSMASAVLQRAQKRRENFWGKR
ncbi:nuclear protein MDM1 isoform X1 [Seriola lalandi dorsalis]|uniref:nuclear protein MDM1 isoform X1 n=1 Tax=Seriola lalandi dorsalis TaxID=1841481 RepID=UPI000C6F5516|nr:nuclear protein MDM1 isoform X1 [Seriola lalandi dorsalis]